MSEQLRSVIRFYLSPSGAIIKQFLAEGQTDPEFREAFLQQFILSRREATRLMWERGIERGEIDPGIDIAIAMDLIYGPLMFRVMTGHAPLNDREAEKIVEAAFRGMATKDSTSTEKENKENT